MNILPSTLVETTAPTSQRTTTEVLAVRALQNPGERLTPRRGPQGSAAQQEDAIDRLRRQAEPEGKLPLRGRRAVAAYTSLDRADEQAYMRQVLGFEIRT